ncbi:UDP-N-acetylmuramate dehydrogenase [Bulleidia sp. zg-1006]|nr:UDP-N-acetylmuramate dehydrogenase [Bulleidia sp. zg-1006]QRG87476.1 UDP-N-acetylmuramate dehydrogenase [Bulleidia sp. zg-1006]
MDIKERLQTYAKVEVGKCFSDLTTLHIGGPVQYVIYPDNLIALDGVLRILKQYEIPYKMVGKGSNLLASDEEFKGAVIRFDRYFNEYYIEGNEVVALAGCSTIALSNACMKAGLSGLEFSGGIPGTVGGNVFMNAGAYKENVADVLKEVLVYVHGEFRWLTKEECDLSYRHSIFKDHRDWIILAARYVLKKKDVEEISSLMSQRKERRLSTQPLQYPSCGSIFKNPEGYYSWQLIDNIGYRGKRVGDAMVSEKHSNFIINIGHAKANDYLALIQDIQQKVKKSYQIDFIPEVEIFNWQEKKK